MYLIPCFHSINSLFYASCVVAAWSQRGASGRAPANGGGSHASHAGCHVGSQCTRHRRHPARRLQKGVASHIQPKVYLAQYCQELLPDSSSEQLHNDDDGYSVLLCSLSSCRRLIIVLTANFACAHALSAEERGGSPCQRTCQISTCICSCGDDQCPFRWLCWVTNGLALDGMLCAACNDFSLLDASKRIPTLMVFQPAWPHGPASSWAASEPSLCLSTPVTHGPAYCWNVEWRC